MSAESTQDGSLPRFDAYDVFGYLIPGVVLSSGIYIHLQGSGMKETIHEVFGTLPASGLDFSKWPPLVAITGFLAFALYVVGHVVAAFGAALLDKLVVERTQGFPYEQLFNKLQDWVTPYERGKRSLYKVTFSIGIGCLVWMAARGPTRVSVMISAGSVLFFLFVPLELYRKAWGGGKPSVPPERLLWYLHVPAIPFDLFLRVFVGVFMRRKSFRNETQKKFAELFKQTFNVDPCHVATDVFWLTYAYLCQNQRSTAALLQHWLRLYAFARNLAAAFLLLYVYGLCTHRYVKNHEFNHTVWYLATGLPFLLFGARFYHIYYNYYSKFTFRAFITAAQAENAAG